MLKGIDISKWQGSIDINQVKKAVDFVILRTGYSQHLDARFMQYVVQCKSVELPIVAVYHFSYALSAAAAKKEATFCVEQVEKAGLGKDITIFFDLEYDSVTYAKKKGISIGKHTCIAHTAAFCEEVERLGYKAGVYFNKHYRKSMYDETILDRYVNWLADWTGEADFPCAIHQYASNGQVPGIHGNVDMNYIPEPVPVINTFTAQEEAIKQIAREILHGKWGNGEDRKEQVINSGHDYNKVQYRVNRILRTSEEVIAGKWGNGEERKQLLTASGYDYATIQEQVNIALKR